MPFGLKNAPSIFQRKMDSIFREYDSFVAIYIDDVLVYSENKKKHIGCKTRENSNFRKKGKIVISVKIRNFSKSRMMKRTSPLESSHEI